MKIKILHLSDVHFGISDPDNDSQLILNALQKKIESEAISADFLCFTGDLAQIGDSSELDAGGKWLAKLAALTGSKIVLCPGNHEVSRSHADEKTLAAAAVSEDLFAKWKSELYGNHPHIKNFLQWSCEFKASEATAYLNGWADNPFIDFVDYLHQGINFRFICLNTAIASYSDKDEGQLIVDPKALQDQLTDLSRSDKLVVLMTHHPPDWLAPWCREKFLTIVKRETGPNLFLHGHLHKQGSVTTFGDDGTYLSTYAAGACYQGTKYPQHFNLLELDIAASKVSSQTYQFVNRTGLWELDPTRGRPIPITLPRSLTISTTPDQSPAVGSSNVSNERPSPLNPFDFVVANDMNPAEIPRLFVESSNSLKELRKHFDSFVEGQRGTGKTMLLRYFSSEVQTLSREKSSEVSLATGTEFIGVYCRLSQYGFNRTDLDAIESEQRKIDIFEQRLTAFLFSRLFSCLDCYFQASAVLGESWDKTLARLSAIFKDERIESCRTWGRLSGLVEELTDQLIAQVDEHLASLQPGAKPTELNTWLTLSASFCKFLGFLRKEFCYEGPFFLLLDDFDAFTRLQQKIVFTVAAERNHATVCFKFGSMTFGCPQKVTIANHSYRRGHDYDLIELNWIDRGLHTDQGKGNYAKAVQEVAKKRLEFFGWPVDRPLGALLKNWEAGNKLREELRKIRQAEYDKLPPASKPKTFQSYWDKRKDIEFLRYLRSKKIEHRYAGINTVIDVSSGIYRQFLEVCSGIFVGALDSGWTYASNKKISESIQNTAIRKYSEDMIASIGETAGDSSRREFSEHDITSQNLVTFSESVCQMFSDRLYNTEIKDAAVIDIAIKDKGEDDSYANAILRVAVRESILQPKSFSYSDKSDPSRKLPTYTLNRRLVPRYNLFTRMQGRIELTERQIELAATDTRKFLDSVKPVKRKRKNENQFELLDAPPAGVKKK